ncbi:hypothetical protein SAMN05216480_10211 [Pustulibacterium marinum]|uniref:Histidyl-tRNA synthetase n=1 Tax=Pustulibacterium marinum TaxID=1224947 RepID=A0A1I7FLW6_9FLAO|nr:DUF6495 family protein [Pustulibacterium marinum]SFU37145.1 hypothetical protein SAMN05216480_10211 [Pustulibacterium marinum]
MKYTRLTKEQLEEMHEEFATFLAAQQITAEEWKELKTEKPEVAEQELDVFSDLVWEKVLSKVEYIDKIDAQSVFLFQIQEQQIRLIVLKTKAQIDCTTQEGMQWVLDNYQQESVEVFQATKKLSEDRNQEIFELIQQGGSISKGDYYTFFSQLI